MMTAAPQKEDVQFDFLKSKPGLQVNFRMIGGIAAAVLIVGIILVMSTDLASWILPMDDQYFQILVPQPPDRAEPLSLKSLDHQVEEKTLTVRGSVANRTNEPIRDLMAVVSAMDTTGRFGQTIEVPMEPPELAPQGTALFSATVTLQESPDSYSVKFRLKDGPFVPHKDERTGTLGVY